MRRPVLKTAFVFGLTLMFHAGWWGAYASADPNRQSDVSNNAILPTFGIIGDGIVDDSDAIQRAIDSGIGDIALPKGTYRITKPLVFDLDKIGFASLHGNGVASIRMDGPGAAVKFVGTHLNSADPWKFEQRVWDRQRMPLVDAIAITGGHEEADGIEAVGTMQLTITRVHIRKCRHGVRLVNNNRNLVISNSHIYENSGIGIFYDDVNLHQSNITGTHISYNRGGGIVARGGNVRNIHISGCDLEANMSPEYPPTANVLIDCRNGSHGTAEVAITGCTIQHSRRAPGSANVRIIGNSKFETTEGLSREGHITINGNILSDVGVNVHLKQCRGVTMSGNTFWMATKHNLLIENCHSVVMAANNMDRNPRYHPGGANESNNSVVIRDCEDCTISGLHMTNVHRDPAALTIQRCRRMNISQCTILDCDNVGILLDDLSDSRIGDCLIRNDRNDDEFVPVRIIGGKNNEIDDRLLKAAEY
tara:strand:+ start:46844 stop:48274 length:1431 start_codon:yes stop_codon:yes gene_type:complete